MFGKHRTHIFLVCRLLDLLQFSWGLDLYEYSTKYVNHYLDCSGTFQVSKNHVYKVESDTAPGTSNAHIEICGMAFAADPAVGKSNRLCLIREAPLVSLRTTNFTFIAEYSGHYGKRKNDLQSTIIYVEQEDAPELCGPPYYSSIFMVLMVKEAIIDEERSSAALTVDFRTIEIHLKVLHIGSRKRRVDMELGHCGWPVQLDHSAISVYNRRSAGFPSLAPFQLADVCRVPFEKDPSENRSICVVYTPQEGARDCDSEWSLSVTRDLDSAVLHSINCDAQPQAWCAPSELNRVFLTHTRESNIWSNQTEVERPEMYRVIVTDFPGGDSDQVLRYTQAWLAEEASDTTHQATSEEDAHNSALGLGRDANSRQVHDDADDLLWLSSAILVLCLAVVAVVVTMSFVGSRAPPHANDADTDNPRPGDEEHLTS